VAAVQPQLPFPVRVNEEISLDFSQLSVRFFVRAHILINDQVGVVNEPAEMIFEVTVFKSPAFAKYDAGPMPEP